MAQGIVFLWELRICTAYSISLSPWWRQRGSPDALHAGCLTTDADLGRSGFWPPFTGPHIGTFLKNRACNQRCTFAQSNGCHGRHLGAGREKAAAGRSRRLAGRARGRRAPSAGWPAHALPEPAMTRPLRCPPSSHTPPAAFPTAPTSEFSQSITPFPGAWG